MRILITGAAGLYGSHLIGALLKRQEISCIFGVDNFSRTFWTSDPSLPGLYDNKKFFLIKGNYQDLTVKQINNLDVDIVVHFAGYTSNEESMETPEEYFLNNEYGVLNFLQVLQRTKNRPVFILASTIEAYRSNNYNPILGSWQPETIFSATKGGAERLAKSFFEYYNYPLIIVRNTNTYGPNQNLSGFISVIPKFILKALKNEPLIIYNDGEQKRDFLYVKDAVEAYAKLILNHREYIGKTLHLLFGKSVKIKRLAQIIKEITCSSSELIYLPEKTGDLPALVNNQNLCQFSDWKPAVSLNEGLRETVDWIRSL